MSTFGTHGVERAMRSAASVHINQYMAHESAENIKRLQAELKSKE